jgi:hypothetical protein
VTPHQILEAVSRLGTVLAVKQYRLTIEPPPPVPGLPCLDHEAMLHEGIPPHLAAYLRETSGDTIHELVFIPGKRLIEVDTVSTWGEASPEAHERMAESVRRAFPEWRVRIVGPSWWRGERRVAEACRAQVTLRDVLLGEDVPAITARINRLQTIGSLMEKQSRVASWGVRTVTGPLLAAAGVVTLFAMGSLTARFGEAAVAVMRYSVVGLLGVVFVYYGLKAVQLTEMSNRVWKRTAEYTLILAERRRLTSPAGTPKSG